MLRIFKSFSCGLDFLIIMFAQLNLIKTTKMKKKFFNLAVAMSVIASSLAFASCGDDEEEDDAPKQEQNTNNNTNNDTDKKEEDKKPAAEAVTSFTAKKGDSYVIANSKVNATTTMTIDNVEGTTVTITVSGLGTVTIGSANEDKSYAVVATNGKLEAIGVTDAKKTPEAVLFICKANSVIASGTEAASAEINSKAGKTTFTKQ